MNLKGFVLSVALCALSFPAQAQWNPLDKTGTVNLSAGNLTATNSVSAGGGARSVTSFSTGKLVFELTQTFGSTTSSAAGMGNAASNLSTSGNSGLAIAFVYGGLAIGQVYVNNVLKTTCGASFGSPGTNGQAFDVAVDVGNQLMWVTANGTWCGSGNASGDPVAETNGIDISGIGTRPFFIMTSMVVTNDTVTMNCAGPFAHTAVGYSAWCAAGSVKLSLPLLFN